jgi:hypothetical protein
MSMSMAKTIIPSIRYLTSGSLEYIKKYKAVKKEKACTTVIVPKNTYLMNVVKDY